MRGTALNIVQQLYGYIVKEVEQFIPVLFAGSGQQILENNGDRVGMLIVNVGQSDIRVTLASNVLSNLGFILTANGGSFSANVWQDFTLPTRSWSAIGNTANSGVYVLEIIGIVPLPPGK